LRLSVQVLWNERSSGVRPHPYAVERSSERPCRPRVARRGGGYRGRAASRLLRMRACDRVPELGGSRLVYEMAIAVNFPLRLALARRLQRFEQRHGVHPAAAATVSADEAITKAAVAAMPASAHIKMLANEGVGVATPKLLLRPWPAIPRP